jgi:hypothetical protein
MADQNQSRQDTEARIITHALEDEAFRQELLNNPKAAIEKELGQKLPEDFQISVLQESDKMTYLVLPFSPAANQELSEEQLEAVAGGQTIQIDCTGTWCISTETGTTCG